MYSGIHRASQKHGVDIIGGDISGSFSGLVINITVIGSQKKDEIVYRSGAREGDLIVVSGDLGSAYLGLQILLREQGVLDGSYENKTITQDIKKQMFQQKEILMNNQQKHQQQQQH